MPNPSQFVWNEVTRKNTSGTSTGDPSNSSSLFMSLSFDYQGTSSLGSVNEFGWSIGTFTMAD